MEREQDGSDQEIDMVDVDELGQDQALTSALGVEPTKSTHSEDWEAIDESEELDDTFGSGSMPELPPQLARAYRGHRKAVLSIAADPSTTRFSSGSMDDCLLVWAIDNDQPLARHKFQETVSLVRYSHNGDLLFAATLDGHVHVIDNKGEGFPVRHTLEVEEGEVTVV